MEVTTPSFMAPALYVASADPSSGVAYDTEKEFDTMFTRKPYVNEYKNDWA
jgi:hypothetical protein